MRSHNDYLDNPVILEKFNKNYLNNLKILLDDNKFNQKVTQLPEIKSAMTSKIEKMVEKKGSNNNGIGNHLPLKEMNSKNNKKTADDPEIQNDKKNSPHNKPVLIRYIILDPENKQIDYNNIDDNFQQYTTKLINPYRSLLHEENEKIKKQAIEQILNQALTLKIKKEKTRTQSKTPLYSSIIKEKEISNNPILNKFNQLTNYQNKLTETKNKDNFDNFVKFFKENCELNNFITIDQKIDYFVLLKGNSLMNIKKESDSKYLVPKNNNILDKFTDKNIKIIQNSQSSTKKDKNNISLNNTGNINAVTNNLFSQTTSTFQENKTPTNRETLASLKSKFIPIVDYFNKYIVDLKTKFKINDDNQIVKTWESFYNDLMVKIATQKNVENSVNTIEKIKYYLNCREINPYRVILRESEISSDRFYFLTSKQVFDFKIIQHINLSKNQLGDLGGSYLLYLIDTYSSKMDYLNISYNKLGKSSIETLTNILQKNQLKLFSLDISGNQIGDKNFSEICVGISKNSYLLKLYTNENDLGKISATILGTILRYDKKLKVLDVSKNNFDDNIIGFLLKGLISNVTLEILYVNENNLSNNALRNFETTFTINTSIREIFLERNNFNNKACDMISEIMNRNKFLEYISLAGNKFKNEAIEKILDLQKKVKAKIISKTDYYQTKLNNQDKINFFEFL